MKTFTLLPSRSCGSFFHAGRFCGLAMVSAALCGPSLGLAAGSILKTGANYSAFGQAGVSIAAPFGTTISNSLGTSLSLTSITGTQYLTTQVATVSDIPAGNDLATAYTALSAMDPTSLKASSDILGSSAGSTVLEPGVYRYETSAQLQSTLTLDAKGKNGVFWVFQIGTTLDTAAGSQVVFTNLGSNHGADNGVFWLVGTTATLGSSSLLIGNILTGSAAIDFGTTAQLDGGAYAHTGVTMAGTNVIDTSLYGGLDGGVQADANGGVQIIGQAASLNVSSVAQQLPVILSLNGAYTQTIPILNGTATLTYLISHNDKGALSGTGTLSFVSLAQSFTEPMTVTGRVTRAGTVSRVQLHTRSSDKHLVDVNSVATPFSFKGEHMMEFDPQTLSLVGRTVARAGLGKTHDTAKNTADVIALPSGVDGSWTLTSSAPDAKGAGVAVLDLADGSTLDFQVHATMRSDGTSVYKLKGEGDARGSTLNLTLDVNQNVTLLSGNVMGQPVKKR